MEKTVFRIAQMDCPSEEQLVRMKLEGMPGVEQLGFDLSERMLTVFHSTNRSAIENAVYGMGLGGVKVSTEPVKDGGFTPVVQQKRLLWTVLLINFGFFVIEVTTGLISKSMGLVADGLDMLADALVYGISLYAVGGTMARKKKVARWAGYFQITLAVIGFAEILRRFIGDEKFPDFQTMIVVSALALIANGFCLYLLQKSKSQEAHMRASMIFTSNDVIINLGVILAGLLVNWLDSGLPDLIIGAIVFALVIRGAVRILQLGE